MTEKVQRNFRIPKELVDPFESSVELQERQRWLLYSAAMLAFLSFGPSARKRFVEMIQTANSFGTIPSLVKSVSHWRQVWVAVPKEVRDATPQNAPITLKNYIEQATNKNRDPNSLNPDVLQWLLLLTHNDLDFPDQRDDEASAPSPSPPSGEPPSARRKK